MIIWRKFLAMAAVVAIAMLLWGCGGGFSHDSSNAQSVGSMIFGADSSAPSP